MGCMGQLRIMSSCALGGFLAWAPASTLARALGLLNQELPAATVRLGASALQLATGEGFGPASCLVGLPCRDFGFGGGGGPSLSSSTLIAASLLRQLGSGLAEFGELGVHQLDVHAPIFGPAFRGAVVGNKPAC